MKRNSSWGYGFLIAVVMLCTDVRAATITVNSNAEDGPNINNTVGGGNPDCDALDRYEPLKPGCTIREAFAAAECNVAVNECAAGEFGTPDTIVLQAGETYHFTTPIDTDAVNGDDGQGPNALCKIRSSINLDGQGATLLRTDQDAPFRFFHADNFMHVQNVTLQGGHSCTDARCFNGGAFLVDSGIYAFDQVTFIGNSSYAANAPQAGVGGALALSPESVDGQSIVGLPASLVTISNSTFAENQSASGGAILGVGVQVTISGTTFRDNEVPVASPNQDGVGGGGAIAFLAGNLSVSQSAFIHNRTVFAGGAVLLDTLRSFDGLLTIDKGPGIFGLGSTSHITRTTFSGNEAGFGGAIFSAGILLFNGNNQGSLTLAGLSLGSDENSCGLDMNGVTLSENTATESGGALYHIEEATCLGNSILSGNSDDHPEDAVGTQCGGKIISKANNVLDPNTEDASCILQAFDTAQEPDLFADAQLNALDESQDTPGFAHYSLKATSPACNAANRSTTQKDQLGAAWKDDPDIGSIESCSTTAAAGGGDDGTPSSGGGDGTDTTPAGEGPNPISANCGIATEDIYQSEDELRKKYGTQVLLNCADGYHSGAPSCHVDQTLQADLLSETRVRERFDRFLLILFAGTVGTLGVFRRASVRGAGFRKKDQS